MTRKVSTDSGTRRHRAARRSLRVRLDAGIDPLTGKRLYLSEKVRDERDAERILNRLRVQVAEHQNARTRATLSLAMREWLASHDVEENTKRGYEGYLRHYVEPAIGNVSLVRSRP
jgi:integrase